MTSSAAGFESSLQPPEKLCTESSGRGVAYSRKSVYVMGLQASEIGNYV
jgi:hypothetical protein